MEYAEVTTLFDSDEAEYMKEREENKKPGYIDREWLLNEGIRVTYGYNQDGLILVPMRDVRESIKKAPSADVVPRSELEALRAFKAYFDSLYGTGLEVANWHQNGQLEPFDNFYDSAVEEMEDHHG